MSTMWIFISLEKSTIIIYYRVTIILLYCIVLIVVPIQPFAAIPNKSFVYSVVVFAVRRSL